MCLIRLKSACVVRACLLTVRTLSGYYFNVLKKYCIFLVFISHLDSTCVCLISFIYFILCQ